MPLRKIARIVDAAYKDADQARRRSQSPEFRKAVNEDRRETLSDFTTVKHALKDRAAIEKKRRNAAAKKGGSKKK